MKKNLFFVFGILFLILVGPFFVYSYSGELFSCPECPSEDFQVMDIIPIKENNQYIFNFKSGNEIVKVGENVYNNLMNGSKMIFDISGEMKEAELFISENKDAFFSVGGGEPRVFPAGSKVVFKDGKLTVSGLKKGESFSFKEDFGKINDITIEGRGVTIIQHDGSKFNLDSADMLGYNPLDGFYYKPGTEVTFGEMALKVNNKVKFRLDGKSYPGESVISYHPEGGVVISCKNPSDFEKIYFSNIPSDGNSMYDLRDALDRPLEEISQGINRKAALAIPLESRSYFSRYSPGGREYLGRAKMSEFDVISAQERLSGDRTLSFEFIEPNSVASFFVEENDFISGVPTIESIQGGYKLETGSIVLRKDERGRTLRFRNPYSSSENSLEVVVVDKTNLDYDKRFYLGDNSNIHLGISPNESPWVYEEKSRMGNEDFPVVFNSFESEEVLYNFMGTENELSLEFERIKNELNEYREPLDWMLNQEYLKKGYSREDLAYFNLPQDKITLEDFERAKDFSVSPSESIQGFNELKKIRPIAQSIVDKITFENPNVEVDSIEYSLLIENALKPYGYEPWMLNEYSREEYVQLLKSSGYIGFYEDTASPSERERGLFEVENQHYGRLQRDFIDPVKRALELRNHYIKEVVRLFNGYIISNSNRQIFR